MKTAAVIYIFTIFLFITCPLTGVTNCHAQMVTKIKMSNGQEQTDLHKVVHAPELENPVAAVVDDSGNIIVADFAANKIQKIQPNGTLTTIAGNGTNGFGGDGGPAILANLSGPSSLAISHDGTIYIADYFNNRIRKIDPSGIITTYAGSARSGYSGDGGRANAAMLDGPSGLALDELGNLYVADNENNCIRRIDKNGIIHPFAGNANGQGTGRGNFSGDGKPAVLAEINHPRGLAADSHGNIYFADCFNHRVRKVNKAGIISTVCGNGNLANPVTGTLATSTSIAYPSSIAIGNDGTIYLSAGATHKLYFINPSGVIAPLSDNIQSGQTTIDAPTFVTINPSGGLLVGDKEDGSIKAISNIPTGSGITNSGKHYLKPTGHDTFPGNTGN